MENELFTFDCQKVERVAHNSKFLMDQTNKLTLNIML